VCPGAIRTPFFDDEALRRLPPVARKQMAEPEGLVEAIVNALRKGKREITYPGWIRIAYPVQALFPRVFRWQMKRNTLGAMK
jgi:short-subunit dehydrogenase